MFVTIALSDSVFLNVFVVASAHNFAKEQGIILKLGADGEEDIDGDEVPRYVPVEDISAFPEETEYLFSGNQNKFKLVDIYDCRTRKWHTYELSAIGNFQQMLQNGNPEWTNKEILRIQEYVRLITANHEYVN